MIKPRFGMSENVKTFEIGTNVSVSNNLVYDALIVELRTQANNLGFINDIDIVKDDIKLEGGIFAESEVGVAITNKRFKNRYYVYGLILRKQGIYTYLYVYRLGQSDNQIKINSADPSYREYAYQEGGKIEIGVRRPNFTEKGPSKKKLADETAYYDLVVKAVYEATGQITVAIEKGTFNEKYISSVNNTTNTQNNTANSNNVNGVSSRYADSGDISFQDIFGKDEFTSSNNVNKDSQINVGQIKMDDIFKDFFGKNVVSSIKTDEKESTKSTNVNNSTNTTNAVSSNNFFKTIENDSNYLTIAEKINKKCTYLSGSVNQMEEFDEFYNKKFSNFVYIFKINNVFPNGDFVPTICMKDEFSLESYIQMLRPSFKNERALKVYALTNFYIDRANKFDITKSKNYAMLSAKTQQELENARLQKQQEIYSNSCSIKRSATNTYYDFIKNEILAECLAARLPETQKENNKKQTSTSNSLFNISSSPIKIEDIEKYLRKTYVEEKFGTEEEFNEATSSLEKSFKEIIDGYLKNPQNISKNPNNIFSDAGEDFFFMIYEKYANQEDLYKNAILFTMVYEKWRRQSNYYDRLFGLDGLEAIIYLGDKNNIREIYTKVCTCVDEKDDDISIKQNNGLYKRYDGKGKTPVFIQILCVHSIYKEMLLELYGIKTNKFVMNRKTAMLYIANYELDGKNVRYEEFEDLLETTNSRIPLDKYKVMTNSLLNALEENVKVNKAYKINLDAIVLTYAYEQKMLEKSYMKQDFLAEEMEKEAIIASTKDEYIENVDKIINNVCNKQNDEIKKIAYWQVLTVYKYYYLYLYGLHKIGEEKAVKKEENKEVEKKAEEKIEKKQEEKIEKEEKANMTSDFEYEVFEDEKSYKFEIDLPGVSKEDIEIEYDGEMLIVTVVKGREKLIGKSFRYQTGDINEEEVDAKFENGVLTLVTTKKNKRKKINVNFK